MPTPLLNVRVDPELKQRAAIAAEAKGSDLSTEIRAFLERLAKTHERKVAASK